MSKSRRPLLISCCALPAALLFIPLGCASNPPATNVQMGRADSPLAAERVGAADEAWRQHPALADPDDRSHRGGKMVAADIDDPRVLVELSRRFKAADAADRSEDTRGWLHKGRNFQLRQEYLLRLLDYYHFSQDRLTGKTKTEVEAIFGPGNRLKFGADPAEQDDMLAWQAGRDTFIVYLDGQRVTGTYYAMGY